mgnify:CR=1 FL=1
MSQIQASVSVLRNIRGLPWSKGHKKKVDEDILEWRQVMFGFQVSAASARAVCVYTWMTEK